MPLTLRLAKLEAALEARRLDYVLVTILRPGVDAPAFGIAAEGPAIERRRDGPNALSLVLRAGPDGLAMEQLETLVAIESDSTKQVVKVVNLS